MIRARLECGCIPARGRPPVKIVIAPDSFKGSLSRASCRRGACEGIRHVWPDAAIQCVPLADGGEGTVEALVRVTGGQVIDVSVTGPLGYPVEAFFGILGTGDRGHLRSAAASGLPLVPPEERDPTKTTTRGTGELIRYALDAGCRRMIIGIGGGATNDGGVGMAQALGASFRDERGEELPGGLALADLATIDLARLDSRIQDVEIVVACDVDNPLYGLRGASAVYGPQKGATPEMVEQLDRALRRLAEVIQRELGLDVQTNPRLRHGRRAGCGDSSPF